MGEICSGRGRTQPSLPTGLGAGTRPAAQRGTRPAATHPGRGCPWPRGQWSLGCTWGHTSAPHKGTVMDHQRCRAGTQRSPHRLPGGAPAPRTTPQPSCVALLLNIAGTRGKYIFSLPCREVFSQCPSLACLPHRTGSCSLLSAVVAVGPFAAMCVNPLVHSDRGGL